MELVSAYLYNRIPVDTSNIMSSALHLLKRNEWYTDTRSNSKFTMLNKRIMIGEQTYRVLIRFEHQGLSADASQLYKLSLPCPFLITECVSFHETKTGSIKWKDTNIFHGPKLKGIPGYLESGVPSDLIDKIYEELKQYVQYDKGVVSSASV